MKPGTKTTLRVAALSASSLLVAGIATSAASASTHHATTKAKAKATTGTTPDAGRPPGGPMNIVHGVDTVKTMNGGYETYATQAGTVTAVSATSITVVSADKFSATYAIDADTVVAKDGAKSAVSDVATSDTVFVRAEQESDGSYTAEMIGDGKPPAPKAGQGHPGGPGGLGGPRGPGGPGGPGAPTGSGSGEGTAS